MARAARAIAQLTVAEQIGLQPLQLPDVPKGLCRTCGKEAEGGGRAKRCSRCRGASYCSREFQAADYPAHKQACLAAAAAAAAAAASGGPAAAAAAAAAGGPTAASGVPAAAAGGPAAAASPERRAAAAR